MNLFAVVVCFVAVLMLSGVSYDLAMPEANPKFAFTIISFIYGAGFFGLYCMYDAKNRKQPWLQLFAGVITLMLAYASLEILLLTGFGK